uniref:Uncharacterized protein n=1 Tax=Parascaris univalens TaxID=6257 RepID=A0A915BBF1_PARUN
YYCDRALLLDVVVAHCHLRISQKEAFSHSCFLIFFVSSDIRHVVSLCANDATCTRCNYCNRLVSDSSLFIIETAVVGMSIINIIVSMAVICIDCCLERQERKLRYEYLNIQRAIISQEENIQRQ